jgi:hypothetical protein
LLSASMCSHLCKFPKRLCRMPCDTSP